MSFLDYSAFDPIFWLHHTNVDRLFAMWQAVNPTSQMTPALEPGTYSIPRNNIDTAQTPLYPFTSTISGQLYTSASSLTTAKFNYAYPEIEDWNQSVDQLKTNVTAQINRLYDPNGIWQITPPLRAKRTALKAGAVTKAWSVAVKVEKFDLDGEMFRIRLFLGDIPADPKAWGLCKTLVGTMTIMPEPFAGPKPFPNTTVHDEWTLTNSVIAAGIDPTNTQDVAEYLKKNLDWRVQKVRYPLPDPLLPHLRLTNCKARRLYRRSQRPRNPPSLCF
jgi:tyrosinase